MKIFNEICRWPEFDKDIKKLSKRLRTLEEDLQIFINTPLNLYHKQKIPIADIVPISDLGITYPKIYKARKFACRALKGKGAQSGIRVIYAYFEEQDKIELIEIYYKGDKENGNRQRIARYYPKT